MNQQHPFRIGFLAAIVFVLEISIGSSDLFAQIPQSMDRASIYSIRDFGAIGDGTTLTTEAIQKAIDAAAAAGGGAVYFPPGDWLSGTIFLKSNVALWLEAGATLYGSKDLKDYPPHRPKIRSYTDNYVNRSLIAGEDLDNIAIRGRGRINGNGKVFHKKDYMVRPYVIRLVNCRNVRIEDVTMEDSPMWMQEYLACRQLLIRGIRVSNHVTHNNDGMDIDGCQDVCISDCIIDSDDDGICLKSTLDRPCENVTISNCVISSHCTAIKMGTESNGGFKNIAITNCLIHAPPVLKSSVFKYPKGRDGISLLLVDGGQLDRVVISNIVIDGYRVPLTLRLGNRARPFQEGMPTPAVGSFRNVILSNIIATGAEKGGCPITGQPEQPIENVTLSNIQITFDGGGTKKLATRKVPYLPKAYPNGRMFGDLPAYGFYCRHVAGLKIIDASLSTLKPDYRPVIVADDVKRLVIDSLETFSGDAATGVRLIRCPGAIVRNSGDIPVEKQGDDGL